MSKEIAVNYDESLVPSYELPDPLLGLNGERVHTPEVWKVRREEIKNIFCHQVFGNPVTVNPAMEVRVLKEDLLPGLLKVRRIHLELVFCEGEFKVPALLYLPGLDLKEPVPVFVGLNFFGNHSTYFDEGIGIDGSFVNNRAALGIHENVATRESRGMQGERWPVEMIINRGYGLCTAAYGSFAPDHPDKYREGILRFEEMGAQSSRAIGAWAWGYSRLREAACTFAEVDGNGMISIGHSRLGKTSLWAGALDEAFAMSVSLQSGQGGAALTRRCFGEKIECITTNFPHWFVPKYKECIDRENQMPVDHHELIALFAPRFAYVSSAEEDLWADPKGEFLSCVGAEPVYGLFGQKGVGVKEVPALNTAVGESIGYHSRPGSHCVLPVDWWHIMNFADSKFPKKSGL